MNKLLKRGAALALVATMSMGMAQASSIEGVLNFSGSAAPIAGQVWAMPSPCRLPPVFW